MNNLISVIIATKGKPEQLMGCLTSILNNNYQDYEVLVLDQNAKPNSKQLISSLTSSKIIYKELNFVGKSKALNLGINMAKGKIFAFTDDDCIVDKSWLQEINESYNKYPNAAGIFGNTYPYKPQNHSNEICPATFKANKIAVYRYPGILHYLYLGQGNNMSFRKSTIDKVGLFREWLGPGSPALFGGEESDMIFRILSQNLPLMINPKMVIYHNRWMTLTQEKMLQSGYTYGLMAFFGYYLITHNNNYAWTLIKLRTSARLFLAIKEIYWSARRFCKDIFLVFLELFAIICGLNLGIWMAIRDIITHNSILSENSEGKSKH